jgi:hypothetical protein
MNYRQRIAEMRKIVDKNLDESPKDASEITILYMPESLVKAGKEIMKERLSQKNEEIQ